MGSAPGGFYPADETGEHEIVPQVASAFSMYGMNAGRLANLNNSTHYPVEALCADCGEVIETDHFYAEWRHTGRKPGDPR